MNLCLTSVGEDMYIVLIFKIYMYYVAFSSLYSISCVNISQVHLWYYYTRAVIYYIFKQLQYNLTVYVYLKDKCKMSVHSITSFLQLELYYGSHYCISVAIFYLNFHSTLNEFLAILQSYIICILVWLYWLTVRLIIWKFCQHAWFNDMNNLEYYFK